MKVLDGIWLNISMILKWKWSLQRSKTETLKEKIYRLIKNGNVGKIVTTYVIVQEFKLWFNKRFNNKKRINIVLS